MVCCGRGLLFAALLCACVSVGAQGAHGEIPEPALERLKRAPDRPPETTFISSNHVIIVWLERGAAKGREATARFAEELRGTFSDVAGLRVTATDINSVVVVFSDGSQSESMQRALFARPAVERLVIDGSKTITAEEFHRAESDAQGGPGGAPAEGEL